MGIPKPKEKYRHFKNKDYEIVAISRDCENPSRKDVIYRQLYETEEFPKGTIWKRSLEDFVGYKEFSDGSFAKRFTKIE